VTTLAARRDLSLRSSLVWSAVLHLLVVAGFLVSRSHAPVATPPTYRVTLIAAPAAPRQVGVVRETPPEPERMKAPPTKTPPSKAPKIATPNAGAATPKSAAKPPTSTARPAPVASTAGGGPTGGRGADVANVRTEGIEFPYPVYLQNVVRQIALQFRPPANSALRAEVTFLIRRDGSISGLRLVSRSGAFSFDQDAMGAVEAAARANSFGPLPQGFTEDVLPVIFSFDPRLIR
jgi:protein TonB